MKNNTYILLFVSLIVIGWLLQSKCDKSNNYLPIIDNSDLKDSLNNLKSEIAVLSVLNDSLTNSYVNSKNIKDSVVYRTKTKYITVFDTITNDTINCLPKIYVDTLIFTYENVIKECDSLIVVKDSIIVKQDEIISVQDTIISNDKQTIGVLKKDVKKERKKGNSKGVKGGLIGTIFGFILGIAI